MPLKLLDKNRQRFLSNFLQQEPKFFSSANVQKKSFEVKKRGVKGKWQHKKVVFSESTFVTSPEKSLSQKLASTHAIREVILPSFHFWKKQLVETVHFLFYFSLTCGEATDRQTIYIPHLFSISCQLLVTVWELSFLFFKTTFGVNNRFFLLLLFFHKEGYSFTQTERMSKASLFGKIPRIIHYTSKNRDVEFEKRWSQVLEQEFEIR